MLPSYCLTGKSNANLNLAKINANIENLHFKVKILIKIIGLDWIKAEFYNYLKKYFVIIKKS